MDRISRLMVCTVVVSAMATGAGGCSDERRRPLPTQAARAAAPLQTNSTTPPAGSPPGTPATPAPASTSTTTVLGLTPTLEEAIARRFAPQLRFNAYHNDGNTEPQNRHEDFFPMGVASFLQQLESGQVRLMVQGSRGDTPSTSEMRPFTGAPEFRVGTFGFYPSNMVGDAPGTSPIYVSLYEDPSARQQAADGSGELGVYVEYWLFYPQDRSEARLLNVIPTPAPQYDLTGHRSDWEHTAYRLKVRLGVGATLLGGQVEEGAFFGHSHAFLAHPPELQLLDDAGRPDPAGTHPVVFISQGKHASYPQAGEWKNHSVPGWLASHTDFFRGNGVVVDGWRVPLPNMDAPLTQQAEFAPAAFQTIVARSQVRVGDWTEFMGRWGSDLMSTTGPKAKRSYNDFNRGHRLWTDAKATQTRLKVYADQGITIPPAATPLPIRR